TGRRDHCARWLAACFLRRAWHHLPHHLWSVMSNAGSYLWRADSLLYLSVSISIYWVCSTFEATCGFSAGIRLSARPSPSDNGLTAGGGCHSWKRSMPGSFSVRGGGSHRSRPPAFASRIHPPRGSCGPHSRCPPIPPL